MRSRFDSAMRSIPEVNIVDDPYVKFIIDRRVHEGIEDIDVGSSARKCTLSHNDYEVVTQFNKSFLGITSASSNFTLDISKDIEIPESGLYRMEALILRGPDYEGTGVWMEGNVRLGKVIYSNSPWLSKNWFKTKIRRFTAGTHTITLKITKEFYVAAIKIVPVVRHEGDSDGGYYGESELDVLSAAWSRNSVNEVNPASVDLPFQDSFYQSNHNYSRFIFSLKDSITIMVGENRHHAQPIFGGYLTGWRKSGGILTLDCADSLLNLNADVMYENYAIGTPPEEGKVWRQFSNVYDTIRYMAENTLHRIEPYTVPNQKGFNLEFGTVADYNLVTVSGFGKEKNATEASLGYCLKLYRASTGSSSAVLFNNSSNPYDAAVFPILNIDYKAADLATAMACDLFITMHKRGESVSSAVEYAVNFSGGGGHSNTLGTITPIFNGAWNYISLDLPTLFKGIGVISTEYHVSKIELKGSISSTSPAGAMYLNNIHSYKENINTTRHSNTEVKPIFDIMQTLGEDTGHAIYIQPGLERCDDKLVAQPNQNTTIPVSISDSSNLIECEEYGSKPLEDGFLNQAHSNFNIDDNTVGSSFAENHDSVIHYEEFQRHEFLNDLNNQAEVDKSTTTRANKLSAPSEYLTCKILGNPFLDPNQNILYSVDEHRCSGFGMVKSIEYGYDPEETPKLWASVGVNRPATLYDKILFKVYRDIYNMKLLNPGNGDLYRSHIS